MEKKHMCIASPATQPHIHPRCAPLPPLHERVCIPRLSSQGSRRRTFNARCILLIIAAWFDPARLKLVLTCLYIENDALCSTRSRLFSLLVLL